MDDSALYCFPTRLLDDEAVSPLNAPFRYPFEAWLSKAASLSRKYVECDNALGTKG